MTVSIRTRLVTKKNNLDGMRAAMAGLADRRVLVGVPRENAPRQGDAMTNAEIAYVQNFGAPEANIPKREFMGPGIKAVMERLIAGLMGAAKVAVNKGDINEVDRRLMGVGLIAVASIKKTIRSNIPPPLAETTVDARIARRAGASWRSKRRAQVAANIAAGNAPGAGIFTALIDTGALLNSITFVIRRRKSNKDIVVGKS